MIGLDTSTVPAVMRGGARLKHRLLSHRRSDVTMAQPVAAEIEYGLARHPASRPKTELSERWLLASRELRRIEWTDAVSSAFGRIKADLEREGQPIADFDIAIAAYADAFDATLITSNLSHFERIGGLEVEDWLG